MRSALLDEKWQNNGLDTSGEQYKICKINFRT